MSTVEIEDGREAPWKPSIIKQYKRMHLENKGNDPIHAGNKMYATLQVRLFNHVAVLVLILCISMIKANLAGYSLRYEKRSCLALVYSIRFSGIFEKI